MVHWRAGGAPVSGLLQLMPDRLEAFAVEQPRVVVEAANQGDGHASVQVNAGAASLERPGWW